MLSGTNMRGYLRAAMRGVSRPKKSTKPRVAAYQAVLVGQSGARERSPWGDFASVSRWIEARVIVSAYPHGAEDSWDMDPD